MKIMPPLCFALAALLAGLVCAGSARADRDIVYSARYYLPPGSSGTSHFHLYRINPDGSGKTQITFGNSDDTDPRWSPNGSKVMFIRIDQSAASAACIVDANGGGLTKLPGSGEDGRLADCRWSPNGRSALLTWDNSATVVNLASRQEHRLPNTTAAYWSPDSKMCYIAATQGPDRLYNLATGKSTDIAVQTFALPIDGHKVVWLDNQTIVGIGSKLESGNVFLTTFDITGKVIKKTPCDWPHSHTDPYLGSVDSGSRSLEPLPFKSQSIMYVQDLGISSNRPNTAFWLADTATGKMTDVVAGQFIAWSPDGKQFCTAPARQLAPYGKSKRLYVSSLQVGASTGQKKLRTISGGLVWVTGADWRRAKRNGGTVASL